MAKTEQSNQSTGRSSDYHTPVLVEEVVDWLAVERVTRIVDGTVGDGGHAEAILEGGGSDLHLLAIDRDPEAIDAARGRLSRFEERVEFVRGNYADAVDLCRSRGFGPVDGFLVDAGVSSRQFDDPQRGFSIRNEGPLDMRMGPEAERVDGFLDRTTEARLAEVLRDYGDLPGASRVAAGILRARREDRLETTGDLVDVVEDAAGRVRRGADPAVLVFQALRIAVNDELAHLRDAVYGVPELLEKDGRAVFISFHSLEDRIVKHGFRELARDCVCPPDLPVCGCDAEARVEVLTSDAIRPDGEEIERNPRARSARLRAARVL